jgi:bifunctional ADP-heptose synthase (sugar kinase/adenylyltransferase)
MGDRLVVSVTADEFVNKGPGRPLFPLVKRMAMLKELRCVDRVVASYGWSCEQVLHMVKPDILVRGEEYRNGFTEQAIAVSLGIAVAFTTGEISSSTMLVNRGFK